MVKYTSCGISLSRKLLGVFSPWQKQLGRLQFTPWEQLMGTGVVVVGFVGAGVGFVGAGVGVAGASVGDGADVGAWVCPVIM